MALVGPPLTQRFDNHFTVREKGPSGAPQWLRFLAGVFLQRREIQEFLSEKHVGVLEFSRPEYLLAGWLFEGRRVVTIHGTGPNAANRVHYVIHHLCCLLLPFLADRVQVVGRDASGLPRIVRPLLAKRIAYIDAWHDDRFSPSPLPPVQNAPLRVFYAGRIAAQKNPELLFSIIREAARTAPAWFEFVYFGSDYEAFVAAGIAHLVQNAGFLQPAALAQAIGACHVGLLCSGFGEGSPFIVIEALACGRPFVLPPLPTLVEAYAGFPGVHIVGQYRTEAFLDELTKIREDMRKGGIDPFEIAAGVTGRSQSQAAPALLHELARLAE
jgi:glycosyltransferase involved in cell wall biosynthesis